MTGAYGVQLARRGPGHGSTSPRKSQGDLAAHTEFVTCNNTIEYGFKHIKNELGWADHRLTGYSAIERWWELVFSAYLMVSLQTLVLAAPGDGVVNGSAASSHAWWDAGRGWKHTLNNLRLLIQPFCAACLLLPWLTVFPVPGLMDGLQCLVTCINLYT